MIPSNNIEVCVSRIHCHKFQSLNVLQSFHYMDGTLLSENSYLAVHF